MNSLESFWAAWNNFAPGVAAGVIVGATLGLLGVYVVLRRLVFLSAAIGQAASFGVVLSLFLLALTGAAWWVPSPTVAAVLLAFVATLLVARSRRSPVLRDGALGAMFLTGAAGTILLGGRLTQEMHEIEALLHGVGVAVDPDKLAVVAWVGALVAVVHLMAWRAFAVVSFDPIGAVVRRVPVRLVEIALALSLSVAIATGIRALGVMPVFALSVLPSLTAIRVAKTLPRALLLGPVLGACAGFVGFVCAYVFDVDVGASQVLVALLIALIAEAVTRIGARLGASSPKSAPAR